MIIQDLVEQIISYSHDEDTPDTDLSKKALTWLNFAYHELLQENLAFLKYRMLKNVTIEITDGIVELPNDFYLFEKIKLKNNIEISKEDKNEYNIEGNILFLKNYKDIEIELVYIPEFNSLKLEDDTSSLYISSNYLKSLIWGALVWASIYERGLNTSSELNLFEAKWNQAKQNYKVTLAAYSDQVLRSAPYKFLN